MVLWSAAGGAEVQQYNFGRPHIIIDMEQGLISTKLRSVITLVDKLRDINLESYIHLPKIVAVGTQSSGKSSLVEQIVGLDFLPRGSGVVTRRPLEIRMVYQKDLKEPYGKFAELPDKFTDFTKVKESIEKLTEKVCGTKKNIVDKPIILDVYSGSCPNLTIIDLPGLTRIPIDGQDDNIHEVTTKMIRKYMEEPSTIILCVIAANQDITNDEALHMARSIDAGGERTLGCITKIDIMDRGTDARGLLTNKGEVPLRLGYVGIKNRSQADINEKLTVKQAIENEKMFFSKSPIYSSLPPSCLGTSSLVNKLTTVLTDNICKFLPELMAQIKERKAKLSELVKSYGRPLPKTSQQKQSLIWEMCSQVISEYKKCIVGQVSTLKCQEKLLKTSSRVQQELLICLEEQFGIKPVELLQDNQVEFAIRKFEGSNMPGFPSMSAFLYLMHPLLQNLKLPIEMTLNNVFDELSHIAELIAVEIAHQYIEFQRFVAEKIQQVLNKFRKQSREYMELMMEAQLNYIYTNNPNYGQDIQSPEANPPNAKKPHKNPMVDILRKRVDAYYKVVIKNLRDLTPKNIKYSLIFSATKQIEFEIFQLVNQNDLLDGFLKIGESSKAQRIRNEQQYEILCKAEQFLLTHSELAAFRSTDNKKRAILRQKQLEEASQNRAQKENEKQKQKQLKQKNQPENIKKEQPKKPEQPVPKTNQKSEQKPEQSSGSLFENFFGKKTQKSSQPTAPNTNTNSPLNSSQQPQKQKKSTTLFEGMFGTGQKKVQQASLKPGSNQLTETYNQQVGKATDKAVDNLYANEQFKQKSKQAVTDATSVAAQKKLGVGEQTGKTLGKAAGWIFGQDATQNYLKDQSKKAAREQTQIPPK